MRVTRAKARLANDQASEANNAASKTSPKQDRAPLNDITEVTQNTSKDLVLDFTGMSVHSFKPSPSKAKLLNVPPKHSKEDIPEILEDDNESDSSSAVDEACEELLRPIRGFEVYQIPMHDHDRPATPPSRAVLRTKRRLSPRSHTPRFDPNIHKSPPVRRSPTKAHGCLDAERRDSIIDIIDSRTPLKTSQPSASIYQCAEPELQEEDECAVSPTISMASPVDSPATPRLRKRASRIEDSLAAIDAQEDALDEVQKSLAIVAKQRPENVFREPSTFRKDSSPPGLRASPITNVMSSHFGISSAKPATPNRVTSSTKPVRPRPRSTLYEPTAASARAATPKKNTKPVGSHLQTSVKPVATPRLALATTRQSCGPAKSEARKVVPAVGKAGDVATVRVHGRQRQEANPAEMLSVNTQGPLPIAAARSTGDPAVKRKSIDPPPKVRLTTAARARLDVLKRGKTQPVSNLKTRQATRPCTISSGATKPTAASTIRAAQTQLGDMPASPKRVEPLGSFKKTPVKASANTPVKRSGSVRSMTGLPAAKAQSSLTRTVSAILTTPRKTAADSSPITAKVPLEDRFAAAKRARAEAAERGRLASQHWAEKMKKRQSLDPSDPATEEY